MDSYSWENVKKILEENLQKNRRKKEQYENQLKNDYSNNTETKDKSFPGRNRIE